MEVPDILHSVWIGAARDAIGSLMMDLAEFSPDLQFETWDERLQALTLDAREWCRQHKFAPSLVEDFSSSSSCLNFLFCISILQKPPKRHMVYLWLCLAHTGLVKLSVDAVSLDYPQGPAHGFTNRVLRLGFCSKV